MTNSTFRYEQPGSSILYRFIDLFILVSVFFIAMYAMEMPVTKDYLLVLSAHLAIYSYFAESVQLYRSWRAGRFSKMLLLVLSVQTFSFLLITACLFLVIKDNTFSRLALLIWFFLGLTSLLAWRITAKYIKTWRRRHGMSMQKVAIIGFTPAGIELYKQIEKNVELGFKCIGFFDDRDLKRLADIMGETGYDLQGNIDDAVNMARSGELVKLYICLPMMAEKRIVNIISQLGDTTVDVLLVPDFLLKNLMHSRIGSVGNMDTLSVFESPVYGIQHFFKRTFDILFSLSVLVLISPILLLIAIAVKLTSAGPVFFKQYRYGLDGKQIAVLKFRSMKVMENGDKVVQATKGDSRVTPIGGFLRRTSLDELPQFINVLTGDMSVVGPRPHAVAHNEAYRKQVAYYMLRHKVRPGITGWAQINGWRGETDTLEKMEMRVQYDLEYIRNWSLWLDIKIIIQTVFKGFINKNAY